MFGLISDPGKCTASSALADRCTPANPRTVTAEDVKALLKDTMMEGTGAQSPITIGKTIAETAYQWLNGEEVESYIPIETFLVTADNVDEYGTDGWQ